MTTNQRWSDDEKKAAVARVLIGGEKKSAVEKSLGASSGNLTFWVKDPRFKPDKQSLAKAKNGNGHDVALSLSEIAAKITAGPHGRKTWPEDFKKRVVAETIAAKARGESLRECAKRIGLDDTLLTVWRQKAGVTRGKASGPSVSAEAAPESIDVKERLRRIQTYLKHAHDEIESEMAQSLKRRGKLRPLSSAEHYTLLALKELERE